MNDTAKVLATQIWQALKDANCTNPKTATKIVMLNETQFMHGVLPLLRASEIVRNQEIPEINRAPVGLSSWVY